MTYLYGIANCDKVKRARNWLQEHEIPYRFHDLRVDGLPKEVATRWYNGLGQSLVNKRSTSWRNLSTSERERAGGEAVIDLLVKHPTLIQRPVLEQDDRQLINFDESSYAEFFNRNAP